MSVMKKFNYLIALCIVLGILSCQREDIAPEEPVNNDTFFPFGWSQDIEFDAQITIQAQNWFNTSIKPSVAYIQAWFKNESGDPISIGHLKVEGLETYNAGGPNNPVPQYDYSMSDHSSSQADLDRLAEALLQRRVTIDIDPGSSDYPSLVREVPFPTLVAFSNYIDTIDISQPLTLQWNASENENPEVEEAVGILLQYSPAGQMPGTSETPPEEEQWVNVTKSVTDASKNSVTFSVEELSQLPSSGYLSIFIGRGVQEVISVGGKTILINGLSMNGYVRVPIAGAG